MIPVPLNLISAARDDIYWKKFKTQSLQPAEKKTKNSQQVLDSPLSYNCSLRDSIFFSDAKRLECTKLKDTKLFSNVNIFNAITISFFTSKWKHKKTISFVCKPKFSQLSWSWGLPFMISQAVAWEITNGSSQL